MIDGLGRPSYAVMNQPLRIIDANFNRAVEGLRVVEDYARFLLNDATISGLLKEIRHQLTEAVSEFAGNRADFRDTPGDVGTQIE